MSPKCPDYQCFAYARYVVNISTQSDSPLTCRSSQMQCTLDVSVISRKPEVHPKISQW